MKLSKIVSTVAAVAGALAMVEANASLMEGDPLRIEWLYPNTSTLYQGPWDVVIGGGVEVPNVGGFGSIDIDISSGTPNILFDFTASTGFGLATFNGFRFSDYTGTVADFTGVAINATNMVGLDLGRVTFTANTIDVNFQNLAVTDTTFVGLNVQSENIPEPGSVALVALGLLGLGYSRHRNAS